MGTTKKQHYVPQSYLRRFKNNIPSNVNKTRTWTLQKRTLNVASTRVFEIACENNFYTIAGADDPVIVETLFANDIEPKSEWAISAIIESCDKNSQFYQPHKKLMAHHLSYQYLRSPEMRDRQRTLMQSMGNGLLESIKLMTGKYNDISVTPNLTNLRHMHLALDGDMVKTTEEAFYQMFWTVVKCPPYLNFITSDNPIVIYKGGIQEIGNIVYFPLSPKYLLRMEDYRTAIGFNPDLYDKEGMVTYCDESFVTEANMLQIISSRHHCASAINNYSYATILSTRLPEYFIPGYTRFKMVLKPLAYKQSDGKILQKPGIVSQNGVGLYEMGIITSRLPLLEIRKLANEILDSRLPMGIRKMF